jgi:glycosyltransferase involved in cell wall biosynthesis
MRFVHILVGSPDPRTVNGVNKVVHWLATTQCAMGHHSEVWGLDPKGAAMTHQKTYDATVFKTLPMRFSLTDKLKRALDTLSVDSWVQLHSVYIPEFRLIAKRLKRRGIRYGFTAHGGYLSLQFDKSLKKRVKKRLFSALWENWVVQNASMLHVIGDSEREDLLRRAPDAKAYLIPNGYSCDSSILELPIRSEVDPPSIMFCGRHEIKQKGLDLLFRGFALYRKNGGTLNLVMISGGKDNAYLRSLASELGIADAITWPGILPVDELRSTLRGAAAFVHASRFDVLPTACLEAAALALPLFMSHETNFGDYVVPRNAGWVYAPNTPEVIAETLFKIERTSSEQRLAMGENARRMITEELRWDLICEKFKHAVLDCTKSVSILPDLLAEN